MLSFQIENSINTEKNLRRTRSITEKYCNKYVKQIGYQRDFFKAMDQPDHVTKFL